MAEHSRRQFLGKVVLTGGTTAALGTVAAMLEAAGVAEPEPGPLSGVTNVKDFDARGDGKADDTAALQRAIDQGSALLWLPRGDYKITRGLVVRLHQRGKTSIRGAGARILNESAEPALHVVGTFRGSADPETTTPEEYAHQTFPTVADIEIVGLGAGDGLVLERAHQAVIARIVVHGCRHGIRLSTRNRNVVITACQLFDNAGTGVLYDRLSLHQSIIHGCYVARNAGGGIVISQPDVRNLQIVGNHLQDNARRLPAGPTARTADIWLDARRGSIREGTIVGNSVRSTANGIGVRLDGRPPETNAKVGLFAIAGNTLSGHNVGLLVRFGSGVSIAGNTFARSDSRSIELERCTAMTITGNVLGDLKQAGSRPAGGVRLDGCTSCLLDGNTVETARELGPAIEVQRSSEVNVTGCTVRDPSHCGIELTDAADCRVSDCTVICADRRTMRHAVRLAGACRGLMIVGNRLARGTHGAIAGNAAASLIGGNLVTG